MSKNSQLVSPTVEITIKTRTTRVSPTLVGETVGETKPHQKLITYSYVNNKYTIVQNSIFFLSLSCFWLFCSILVFAGETTSNADGMPISFADKAVYETQNFVGGTPV